METFRVNSSIETKKLCRLASFSCIFIFLFSFACFAQDETTIQNIPVLQFPALLYTQEYPNLDETQRISLMIATIVNDKANIQKIVSAREVRARQLSDTVFFVQADQRPQDRSLWGQTQYIVDFKAGSKVLLCDSLSLDKLVHYYCLRSIPEKNEAVLLRYGQGTDKSTLVHVDLKTLETKTLYELPEKNKMPEFNDNPRVKISPDFKKLAALKNPNQQNQRPPQSRESDYSLRVLDLDTMKIRVIEDNLKVQINPRSSLDYGWPSFEWISSNEILYQNMVPIDLSKSQYILKCANIKDNAITEWLTKQLRLTLDGGSLSYNWLTGELYFQDFLVDIKNKTLLPKNDSYSIKQDGQRTEISFNNEIICNLSDYGYVDTCVSSSKKNFACLIRFNKTGVNAIYMKTNDIKKSVVVSQKSFYTEVIGWIENSGQ